MSADAKLAPYVCRNCHALKTFALFIKVTSAGKIRDGQVREETFICQKIGELPEFGVQSNTALARFLKEDAEVFRKGLACEAKGLGIGAFAYYRRIVDKQKNHLLAEISKVLELQGGTQEQFDALQKAQNTDSFTRSMEQIKGMLPPSLRIDGHNPLQLLYDQLSDGVHDFSDAECLARAIVIREVLAGIAARVAELLQDNTNLRTAISRLTEIQNPQDTVDLQSPSDSSTDSK